MYSLFNIKIDLNKIKQIINCIKNNKDNLKKYSFLYKKLN